ncbi:MAG: hypothetical protein JWR44_2754, partial [Hymenobacter sp.]|nr:hypothetical protein [Hymenobacter sp.]
MRLFLFACLLMTLVFSTDTAAPLPPGPPYKTQWKKIDELLAKSQTTTAAPLVGKIYQQARTEHNTPAYVRALLYKIRLLQAKEEDETEKAIALLEADVKTADFPARPILHSLLAELYTGYLNQNRYRLYQRTAGAAPTTGGQPGADGGTGLATWDMGRLGAAIVRHYYLSVEDEPQRQLKTTLADLGDLAAGGDAEGRALRPTLYDLLAQRAIEGLRNQELYVTRPAQQFELRDPKLFGTAAEFAALRLLAPEGDSLNGQLHALHLLQRLTASRQQLASHNLAALADVDLTRIDYLRSITQNTRLAAQYDPALVRLTETYRALPISTEFMARRAEAARDSTPVAAVRLAREAEAWFPKSHGAARARQLREEIERPELALSAADIVTPNQPWRLDVTLRNVTGLHAWAYRISLEEWQHFGESRNRTDNLFALPYAQALKKSPVASWVLPVPAHPLNYKEQQLVTAGAALPLGYFLVVVSTQPQPPTNLNVGGATAYAVLGTSELSALYQRSTQQGATPVLVVHRQTGVPLAGVSAQATYRAYDAKQRQQLMPQLSEVRKTSATGEAAVSPKTSLSDVNTTLTSIRLWRGADTLLLRNIYSYERNTRAPEADPKCFLFTDRAIYRPGQTVYFKGILVEQNGNQSRLFTKTEQEVELDDVNGQTVQTLQFVTNEFGSFNGSFVLPTGLLNGEFTLSADDGDLRFAVEDYKRPTFFVQLDSVPGRPQLGQPLAMSGRARAYSGQATDGAAVSYRVTRRELWPFFDFDFYGRSGYQPDRGTREIAHGTTATDAEGRFRISFTPPLEPRQPGWRGGQPGYWFEVAADVTDAAGETHTGTRTFGIGRNPLSLRLTGPQVADKQHLPVFTLLGTNATGEPLPAAGTLRVLALRYRPQAPGVPAPVRETPDNEAPPVLIKSLPFDTKASPALNLNDALAALPTGRYRLEARATGEDSARAQLNFTLYDSQAATVPFATPDWFVALADTVAPGQPATVLLGSSEADTHILLEVERGGQLLRKEWLTLAAGEQRRLRLDSGPVEAKGTLYVHTTQVHANRLYRNDATVQVAEKPQALQLSISTFRDRLRPGQRETWRVGIHQANGRAADAELLATLYDQSLDVFRQHSFIGLNLEMSTSSVFEWVGLFGNAYWIGTTTQPRMRAENVAYPYLYTWGVAGFNNQVGVSRALQGRVAGVRIQIRGAAAVAPAPMMAEAADAKQLNEVVVTGYGMGGQTDRANATAMMTTSRPVDLSAVQARTDFRETAFWQPALHTDKNGDVVLEFQMPEAVTRWQLLALAHDKQLHSGQL